MDDEMKFYTSKEVADFFRLSVETVWKRVREGSWPAHRDGRRTLFSAGDIQAIRDQMQPPPPPMSNRERRLAAGLKVRRVPLTEI